MYRSGLVNTLVTHTNIEGFGLTPLSRDRPGYMPLLKFENNKKNRNLFHENKQHAQKGAKRTCRGWSAFLIESATRDAAQAFPSSFCVKPREYIRLFPPSFRLKFATYFALATGMQPMTTTPLTSDKTPSKSSSFSYSSQKVRYWESVQKTVFKPVKVFLFFRF